jgi:hypothetical protein
LLFATSICQRWWRPHAADRSSIDSAPHTIADGATLEIANSASGKITFAGAAGTLQLDSPCGFSGTVAGFGGQDQIDLTVSALARTPRSAIQKRQNSR